MNIDTDKLGFVKLPELETIAYLKPATMNSPETITVTEPLGASTIALVSKLSVQRAWDKAVKELLAAMEEQKHEQAARTHQSNQVMCQQELLALRQRCAMVCQDVFDAYWHRENGGSSDRGKLAAVAQECKDAIQALEIKK